MLNKLRYYYHRVMGNIRANEYIYYPDNFPGGEKNTSKVFTNIYVENTWGSIESVSGKGSETKHTQVLLKKLDPLLKKMEIKSVLDAPCGDYNWMKDLNKSNLDYTGMDIVEDLVSDLNLKYREISNIRFQTGNILSDELPKVDLIFCRDCLVHFSFEDIFKALRNFKNSGSTYLLTTTYIHRGKNNQIQTGGWRAINLEKAPINFPKPRRIIWENNLDDQGMYHDKCMALWNLNDLKI